MRNRFGIFAVVMAVMMFAGVRAQAAGATYSLSCDAATQGKVTFALTSFSTGVSGGPSVQTGGKRTPIVLTVHFEPNAVYKELSSMTERDEVVRNCELLEVVPSQGGKLALELRWTFTNGTVTSVQAAGSDDLTPSGTPRVPEGFMTAVFSFQEVTFNAKGTSIGGSVVKR